MALRIVLVDDHVVVRSGIKVLLESHEMSVVGEAGDGVTAIAEVDRLRPDVVVMDASLPQLGGVEATEQIKKAHPEVKVLVLTAHEERAYLSLFIGAGASGYVLKRAAVEELARAIHAVAEGGMYLDPTMAAQVIPSSASRTRSGNWPVVELSERESEVLRLIAHGHATKTIASQLAVSGRTVETYKTRAMEKLALKNRADVVRYAVLRGWLDVA